MARPTTRWFLCMGLSVMSPFFAGCGNGESPAQSATALLARARAPARGRDQAGGGSRLLQPFDVGDSGVFRQVVVYIESISKGRPFLEATSSRFYADQMVENPYKPCTIIEGCNVPSWRPWKTSVTGDDTVRAQLIL